MDAIIKLKCLINNIYIPIKVIKIYICNTLKSWLRNSNIDFALNNWLFGSVKLIKNTEYKYSSHGIGFDSGLAFSFTDGSMGKNVIIFGVDMSLSVHIDSTNKDILSLGEGPNKD